MQTKKSTEEVRINNEEEINNLKVIIHNKNIDYKKLAKEKDELLKQNCYMNEKLKTYEEHNIY